VPNLLAFLLRNRRTNRSERDDGVGGETDTAGKPTYESFWLLLYPTETDGTYFRAGLYIEKESIETIRGDLGGKKCDSCVMSTCKIVELLGATLW
jgi:hypothetical protein